MCRVAIATDSNSGITGERAASLGVFVLPMSFTVGDRVCREGVDLSQEEFFDLLSKGVEVSTSQPSPGELRALWDCILKEYETLVYIPMSSGLSSSCGTAAALSMEYDGRVQVVNNHRISVTQYQSVLDALALARAGYSAVRIKDRLETESLESSIYIMVDTLEYLKHGGRITPAAAMIGTVLHTKPVLQIQGDKLDSYAKTRGERAARHTMIGAVRGDIEERFSKYADKNELVIHASWSGTGQPDRIDSWRQEICEAFGLDQVEGMPLALSVCCHIGPGALAVTVSHALGNTAGM